VNVISTIGKNVQPAKRRSVLRCHLVATAEVTELGSGSRARLSARTSEIGLGGCYIDTLNPFPESTRVHVRILRDGGVFESNARVVYNDSRFGMGLAFADTTGDQRAVLENWLAELVTRLKES
jgi:hypothetical protein